MARANRIYFTNTYYHIITRGNRQETVFLDDNDYLFYLRKLNTLRERLKFRLHAYALMPNHVHLALATGPSKTISYLMHLINLSYARYFNNKYKKSGHLWQGRFRSKVIDDETYFLELLNYIENNPVRAKMVTTPEDYPWSSAFARANGDRYAISLDNLSS